MAVETHGDGNGFKKNLTWVDLFCLATGAMISSGIFILPGVAFREVGPAVFLSYALAGLVAFLGSLAVIELATAMPKAGGTYYFIDRSLGPGIGTVSGTLSWMSLILKSAFAAYGLGAVVEAVAGVDLVLTASAATVFFLILNLVGTKEAAILEILLVGGLLLIMAGYVVTGAPHLDYARFVPFFADGKSGINIVNVAALVFVSFGGLLKVTSVAEEVRNPQRAIPLGMLGSIIVVTILYVLCVAVTVGILPAEKLASSLTPLADAAGAHYGKVGFWTVSIAAFLAFITTINAGIMSASRYPAAMGRDKLFPAFLGRTVGKNSIPVYAIVITGLLMLGAVQLPLETLVKAASAVVMASYVLTNLAVIILRESLIHNYRPTFRSPWYPYLQTASMIVFSFLISQMGLPAIKICLVITVAALLIYLLYGRRVSREFALLHLIERITNRQLTGHRLEGELLEVLRSRDEITPDNFDELVRQAPTAIYPGAMELEEFLVRVAADFSRVVGLDRDEVLTLLREREAESSTIIAPGVALPHLILPGEDRFHLFIVKCPAGVLFDHDEPPVSAVFMLAGTRDRRNRHLRALSAIAQIISDADFDANWLKVNNERQIRDAIILGSRKRLRH